MRILRLFFASLLLLSVASCASVGKLGTPSTKPEITIKNSNKKQVLDALVAWSAMKGRQVEATTEYSIVTTGQMDVGASGNVLWDVSALARTTYTPIQKNGDVTLYSQRVITYTQYASQPMSTTSSKGIGNKTETTLNVHTNSAHEKTEEYNSQRAYEEMQMELEDFAQFFASQQ